MTDMFVNNQTKQNFIIWFNAQDFSEMHRVTIEKRRPKGTDVQRAAWWVLMEQVSAWMRDKGMKEGVYIVNGDNVKKIGDKPASKEFAHEITMLKLFPVENGKRMSLVKVLKDKLKMCALLDRVLAYYAERGLILVLEKDDAFGYQDYLERQEQ